MEDNRSDKCVVCVEKMELWYGGMFDDRYGVPGFYDLLRCVTCGLVRTSPALREDALPGLYARYYPRKNIDIASLSKQLNDSVSVIGWFRIWLSGADNQGHYYALPGMKVLDYGCGVGISLLELQRMGAEGYGIETDPNVRRVAEHFKLNIHIGSFEEDPFPGTKFDLISLSQVIEHIPEPGRLLRALRERLKDNGRVILCFPNVDSIYRRLFGRRWINWHVPYHVHHFNRNSFSKLCEREGWKVVRWKTVTPNLWTVLQLRALLVHSRMGEPNPLWSPAAARVSGNAQDKRESPGMIHRLRGSTRLVAKWLAGTLIAFINRVIDATGMGDSLLVFIEPFHRTPPMNNVAFH